MKILLINPPRFNNTIPVIREDRCEVTDRYAIIPPYSLLWLSAILRNMGHDVNMIDANGAGTTYADLLLKIQNNHPDVILFRFTPTTFDWDITTAKIGKVNDRNVTIIAICLTLRPFTHDVLERAPDIDIYIPTDWEDLVPEVLGTIEHHGDLSSVRGIGFREKNAIIVTDQGKNPSSDARLKDYDSLPIPAFDLIENFRYYRPNLPVAGNFMVIYTSKGCPFPCIYCTVARTPFRLKSAGKVIEELNILYTKYDVRLVSFFDETFTLDRDRTIQICNAIKESLPGMRWYCNTRVNLVDRDLLLLMRESGCRGIAFGVESGSQTILDTIRKGITVQDAKVAIAEAKNAGLKVYASFIIGLPGENHETLKATSKFIQETLPHSAQFNIAVPYPGTELYHQGIAEGSILETIDWTELYQHRAVMSLKELSRDELEKARLSMYRKLYFNPLWIIQNTRWIAKHPEDFRLGITYSWKILINYFWYRMEHAH